jgi:hypothetical protein
MAFRRKEDVLIPVKEYRDNLQRKINTVAEKWNMYLVFLKEPVCLL